MDHFGTFMFTPAVRAEQARNGADGLFDRLLARPAPEALSPREAEFVHTRTSFYMATVSASGWPYVQHRGGPPGFLRVTGPTTLGFADYGGNRQCVSAGNLAGSDKVALILMDYPRRTRLKVLGHARVVDLDDDPALAAVLTERSVAAAERLVAIDVAAFDWNCSKHITPRFAEAEVMALLGPRIAALERRNQELEARLAALKPQIVGN